MSIFSLPESILFDQAFNCLLAQSWQTAGKLLPSTSKLLKHRAGNGLWHIDSSFKVPCFAGAVENTPYTRRAYA